MAIVLKDVPSDVPTNSPIGMGRRRHDWGSAKEETIRPLNMCLPKTHIYLAVLTLQKSFFKMHLQIKELFDIYFLV